MRSALHMVMTGVMPGVVFAGCGGNSSPVITAPAAAQVAESTQRSQFAILDAPNSQKALEKRGIPRSQFAALESGRNLKYRHYAFTEQGVAVLSSVPRGPRAARVNIAIMRTFAHLRQMPASSAEMSGKPAALEAKHDKQFKAVFDAIRDLMSDKKAPRREPGFHTAMPKPGKVNARVKARKS